MEDLPLPQGQLLDFGGEGPFHGSLFVPWTGGAGAPGASADGERRMAQFRTSDGGRVYYEEPGAGLRPRRSGLSPLRESDGGGERRSRIPGGSGASSPPGGLPSEPVPPALAQPPPECVTDPVAATGA